MSVPERIGRHQIRGRVGTGGFATVWRGYDADLDADVAVKILAENWVSRVDIRERFIDEARLLRRADSDRVVRVHDIGALDDERPYFVMTYADGGTLEDRLAGGPLPIPEVLRLVEESARCVAVLHEMGVLHRDVKPSNILFRSTAAGGERVMIADLGLAKAVANASGFTLSAGSPGYMAPEQATPGYDLDTRVDVYALGAIAYRMLTGVLPTPRRRTPPSHLRPGIDAGLDAVVMRALEVDRAHRHDDAAAFSAALAAASTPPAHPPPRPPVPQGPPAAGPADVPLGPPPSPQLPWYPAPGGQPGFGQVLVPQFRTMSGGGPVWPGSGVATSRPPRTVRAGNIMTLIGSVGLFVSSWLLFVALIDSSPADDTGVTLVGHLPMRAIMVIGGVVLALIGVAQIVLVVHAARGRGGARIALSVLGGLTVAFDVFAAFRGVQWLGLCAAYTVVAVALYWFLGANAWFRRKP